jgi:hypothetical protein
MPTRKKILPLLISHFKSNIYKKNKNRHSPPDLPKNQGIAQITGQSSRG